MMKSPSCSSSSSSTDSFLGQFAGSQFSRALPQAAFTFPSTWATKELMGPWNDRKVSSRVQFQESVVTSLVHAHLTQCEMFLQMQGYCEHIIRRPRQGSAPPGYGCIIFAGNGSTGLSSSGPRLAEAKEDLALSGVPHANSILSLIYHPLKTTSASLSMAPSPPPELHSSRPPLHH